MSKDVLDTEIDSTPQPEPVAGREPFWAGVVTVARLELRQRVRSSRWPFVLGVWMLVLALFTGIVRWAAFRAMPVESGAADGSAGRLVFGVVVLSVLTLGALVVPALSSTSINGDRQAGILATMQVTLLTPLQLALGKLAASWLVALALLAAAAPFMIYAALQGGTTVRSLAVSWLMTAVLLLVVAAIGLGFSAVAARTSSSTLMTYLLTIFMGLGLPMLFLVSIPLVTTQETTTQWVPTSYSDQGVPQGCHEETVVQEVTHTERTWWLLAGSPYTILSSAAVDNTPTEDPRYRSDQSDPLYLIKLGVATARLGISPGVDSCNALTTGVPDQDRLRRLIGVPTNWLTGLALNLALGGLMFGIAVRRLRTPSRRLARGTRVA